VIRLLIDENVPVASVAWLRLQGHDVASILEEQPGAADIEIARWSAVSGRVIVTFDRDFGHLLYLGRLAVPAGLIFLRIVPTDPLEPGQIVQRVLDQLGEGVYGHLTAVDRRNARQRRLPEHGQLQRSTK
jgi:predicted nuclease of predicted toxin-antitoxin system